MILVYFECESYDFGTLMGAIGPNMGLVRNLRVETQEEKKPITRKAPHTRGPVQPDAVVGSNGATYKNSRVAQIMIDHLETKGTKGASRTDLQSALVAAGFSRKSQSPATTYLRRQGVIAQMENGNYIHAKFK